MRYIFNNIILKIKYKLEKRIAIFLTKLMIKLNGSYVKALLVESENQFILVESEDMGVGRNLRINGDYGRNEKKYLKKLINKNSTVAFIGTHVGSLAIPMARIVKKALLIEANPNTYKYLEANIKLNSLSNVQIFNIAVGEAVGEIKFILNVRNSGGSKREPVFKKKMYYKGNPKTVAVPMVTFDSLLVEPTEIFDLIFMDIEGSEYFALSGMQNSLKTAGSLVMEFIPHHLNNVANVSVSELLNLIEPHFSYLYIPSKNQYAEKKDFYPILQNMYDMNKSDDGVIFSKVKVYF